LRLRTPQFYAFILHVYRVFKLQQLRHWVILQSFVMYVGSIRWNLVGLNMNVRQKNITPDCFNVRLLPYRTEEGIKESQEENSGKNDFGWNSIRVSPRRK
jgi:hypothetical protein